MVPPHGRCCDGDHGTGSSGTGEDMGIEYSLYTKIDTFNLECLNEAVENSGKTVFKPWRDRLNFDNYVESDADEELLFNIPFDGNVKLKGVIILGEDSDTHPAQVRLFKNRPKMTFDDVTAESDQEFHLHIDPTGTLEYPTKVVTFNSVHHLTLHFPRNFGAETTRIYYIGLRGEWSEAHRHGVTICTYEVRPNVNNVKNPLKDTTSHEIT